MIQEVWKEYVHPGTKKVYNISNMGKVKSTDLSGKEYEHTSYKNNGYRCIPYRKPDGKNGLLYLHKIVANLFVENPSNYKKLHFKNGNSELCRADNLEWISPERARELNQQQTKPYDIYENYAPNSKLTASKVALIKKRALDNEKSGKTSWVHMAKQFGITPRHLWQIRRGEIWGGVKPLGQEKQG
jgi:hypothetical protein